MKTYSKYQFSPCGKYFAYITLQGKFVVHDVELGTVLQVYTPNMHLNVPCTAFTWIQIGDVAAKPKKQSKKSRPSLPTALQQMVVFGTSKGGLALYSLATGTIDRVFQEQGHSSSVTSVCYDAAHDPDTIYSAGNDGKVIEWSISRCKRQKVHPIGVDRLFSVLAHSGTILAGMKQIKVWDRASETLTRTLTGHSTYVVLLQLVVIDADTVYVASGAQPDRNVLLWSLNNEESTSPVASFALDDSPDYLSVKVVENKLHLVAVSHTGIAHYFIRDTGKLSMKKPYRASHTFEVAIDTVSTKKQAVDRLPVVAATVQYSPNEDQLLMVYGSEQCLRFEHVTIEVEQKLNVIIREPVKMLDAKAKDGELKAKTPVVDDANVEYLNPASSNKRAIGTETQVPMEVRLENLSTPKPHLKNMIHLLIQGLHSRDPILLRNVFTVDDADKIRQTLSRLPPQYVSPLLNELSHMMQMKTMHVKIAVCWLKQLISLHASQLMALGSSNLLANFTTCLGIIEFRVEHLNSLSKLRGRLELLIDQIDRSKNEAANLDDRTSGSVLVYQEGDDSDVDSMLEKDDTDQPGSSNEEMSDEDDEEADDDGDENDGAYENGTGSAAGHRQNGYRRKDSDGGESMEVSD
uniref:Small-subunit processome Utp12 domain-containing protein n=1 Tax=Anopheles farauti TaxID=69004 RepID=A0A182QFU3_9DIPT